MRVSRAPFLLSIAACLITRSVSSASTVPSTKKLVLTGTVTAISQVNAKPRRFEAGLSRFTSKVSKWQVLATGIHLHHPQSRASRLGVGSRYTIEATWTEHGYVVDETRPIKKENAAYEPALASEYACEKERLALLHPDNREMINERMT